MWQSEGNRMYITADEPRRDYRQVTAIEDEWTKLQLFDYVLIGSDQMQWIGQITAPNINISTVGGPFDPAILYAIKIKQANPDIKVQLAETIESWQITLLGEYENGRLRTLRRRPKPGATVVRLDRETTVRVLNLPVLLERKDDSPANVIGYLLNAENVPLCVNPQVLMHHIMVSGGTGSGKSNTGANLVYQATRHDFVVFLYDAKPDYRKINLANTDQAVTALWQEVGKYKLAAQGAANLTRVAIYGVGGAKVSGNYDHYDVVIGFRTSDFDPYLLASLFFDTRSPSGMNQYDEFASVCEDLKHPKDPNGQIPCFTMDDVLAEVKARKEAYENQQKAQDPTTKGRIQDASRRPANPNSPDQTQKTMHPATADAIQRKVERQRKFMRWLDAVDKEVPSHAGPKQKSGNAFDRQSRSRRVEVFKPEELIRTGGIVHLDCSGLSPNNYALFLSRFIELNQSHQTKNREKGVIEFIDEAHRVFDNDSRYSDHLATEFNRVMVEGRSLKHGVIISLQNASQVPPAVLNNVNTHIVMRQNNREVARAATQTMGPDFADLSLTLSTGQALCRMFESSATVLAQMAPSPFELERSDNASDNKASQ